MGEIQNQFECFAIDEAAVIREEANARRGDWKLLRRLRLPERFNDPDSGPIKRAAVVDCETTGLSTDTDEVVQLAILPFDYEVESGRLLTVHRDGAFEGLREPSLPISEEASLVTGISDEMVRGHTIDPDAVIAAVADADLVIAHNAAFDRVMLEKHWQCFAEKPWACTLSGIDWLREGFSAGKLDYLGVQFGWFYDGHTALADCEACVALLSRTLPTSGRRVMTAVREAALQEDFLICAVDAPYEKREVLKKRGYRWRPPELPNGKVWWTTTKDSVAETAWLRAEVYGFDAPIPCSPVTALERFSERLWDCAK